MITASEDAVEMGDEATSIVDRLITPSGCLAEATGVIRRPEAFIPPLESENRRKGAASKESASPFEIEIDSRIQFEWNRRDWSLRGVTLLLINIP